MQLSISKRLFIVSALLSLLLVGVAASAWFRLTDVAANAKHTGDLRVQQLLRIAQSELNVTRASLQLRHAMLVKTPDGVSATLADVGERRRLIDEAFQAYEKDIIGQAGRDFFAKAVTLKASFWVEGEQNIKLIQEGKMDEAFAFLVTRTIPARNALFVALDAERQRQAESLHNEIGSIASDADSTRNQIVGLAIVVAAALLIFSWYVAGVLRRRVGIAQVMADHIRDGDLTVKIRDAESDEISPLLIAMNAMQGSLVSVVSQVRQGSESVATASAEIAQGNNDLSARTEQQASALAETAANMAELGSTVKQNADSARQANQLAQSASTVAIQGGQVVTQVVDTMKGIVDSSRKISDIISVIDGIAFQTNILALNAAVEAARAGEQGRGFAVVASEVRSLAGRSADAAKEIKSLIGTSVERVEHGTLLVDQAGSTMTEVVNAIRRVTDIMGEISAASNAQASGVAHVGDAVAHMDQATQQNAALVEQMAAAASSLKSQANELVQVVAAFNLGNEHMATAMPKGRVRSLVPPATPHKGIERRGDGVPKGAAARE